MNTPYQPPIEPHADAAATNVIPEQAAGVTPEISVALDDRFSDVVTGRFDADEGDQTLAVPKRVLQPQPETPKLHKVLAQVGFGSRLEMEQLILQGRISVNGEPAHVGQRIQFGDSIKINGKPIRVRITPPPARVIAYHKPCGEVVTHDDPQNRPTVFRRLPKLMQGKWQSVGRLDLNTEGLLLLTNSGQLANQLMHPRFGLEREYAVRVLGALSAEEKQRLLDGIELEDGKAQFGSLQEGGGDGANCWYRVTIGEGRHREVRRMFDALGHAVSRLIRIRYGAMVLPRGLKRGAFVELGEDDICALMRASADGAQPAAADDARRTYRDERPGARSGRNNRGPTARGRGRNTGGRTGGPVGLQEPGYRDDFSAKRTRRRSSGPGAGLNSAPRSEHLDHDAPDERVDRLPPGVQPDPMKTAFGYIGANSFVHQRRQTPGGSGPGKPRRSGGTGGRTRRTGR